MKTKRVASSFIFFFPFHRFQCKTCILKLIFFFFIYDERQEDTAAKKRIVNCFQPVEIL